MKDVKGPRNEGYIPDPKQLVLPLGIPTVHEEEVQQRSLEQRIDSAWRNELAFRYKLKKRRWSRESIASMIDEQEKHWDWNRDYAKPTGQLLRFHEIWKRKLTDTSFWGPAVTAYKPGASILLNANPHRHNRSALVLDMRKAFESIKTKHVYRWLYSFQTRQGMHGTREASSRFSGAYFTKDEAWVLARLFTFRGRLRRGSPVMPHIFNLMCDRFDKNLLGMLEWLHPKIVYTRYGDDMCFSSPEDTFPEAAEQKIREILMMYNVGLNERKTRRFSNGVIELPGVVVVRGRLQPRGEYLRKIADGTLGHEDTRFTGHIGFVRQFKRKDRPRILREIMRPSPT